MKNDRFGPYMYSIIDQNEQQWEKSVPPECWFSGMLRCMKRAFLHFLPYLKVSIYSSAPHETLKNHPLCKKSIKALLMLHLKPTSEFLMPVSSLIDARSVEKKFTFIFKTGVVVILRLNTFAKQACVLRGCNKNCFVVKLSSI